ncbi:MAG: SGNH/GDSL hydrolase family protein [Chitinophagales bacterium]
MKNYLTVALIFLSSYTIAQNETEKADWANLEKYKEENAKLKPSAKTEKRVVFMGNSITEGWQHADSFFQQHPQYIDRGISGQTTPQMLLRFRQDVIQLNPSAVVILAGINDIAQNTGPITLEEIFGNIKSMTELARTNNIKVILSSVLPANVIPWRTEIEPADKVIQLNELLKEYCMKNNIYYVDYYSKLVDDKKGLPKIYSEDGVHPNATCYKIMEQLVQEAISKTLHLKT